MWLFTKYGFFSAVCARQGNGDHGQPIDLDRMMIRARDSKHLEFLIARYPEWLGATEIKCYRGTDYAYRIFVAKEVWSQVLTSLGDDVDYDNFKSEVARFQGQTGADYEDALHEVWSVMHQLQR